MKLKRNVINKKVFVIIILIVCCSFVIYNYIGKSVTNKVIDISFDIIEKNVYEDINEVFTGQISDIDSFVNINTNNDEIVYFDYNYNNVNIYLREKLQKLFVNIEKTGFNSQYYDENIDVLMIPLGIVTDNILFSNLGPKIPCKLNIITNIDMSIKTRISDYGINNSLIEVFVLVEVKSSIINPVVEDKFNKKYEIMITSKVIEGKIPSYYGGYMEKTSTILSS